MPTPPMYPGHIPPKEMPQPHDAEGRPVRQPVPTDEILPNAIQIVTAMMSRAFPQEREKRSMAYKNGVISVLLERVGGCIIRPIQCQMGTAKADAYLAGREEGKLIARQAGYTNLCRGDDAASPNPSISNEGEEK